MTYKYRTCVKKIYSILSFWHDNFFLYINGHKITKNIKNCKAKNFHDTWAEWKMKKSFETVKVCNI